VPSLEVSVVTYAPDLSHLSHTLSSLKKSLQIAACNATLSLIDNGPSDFSVHLKRVASECDFEEDSVRLIQPARNVGFGSGHNLSILANSADYHLVLNPDVALSPNCISQCISWMSAHPDCALVAPAVTPRFTGDAPHLCKAYPSIAVLLLRAFAPKPLKRLFSKKLDQYELRDVLREPLAPARRIPLSSGAFMFCNGPTLRDIGGFSPQFFLYFEDFDLCLRLASKGSIDFLPSAQISHSGGDAGRKGFRHIRLFAASALKFYLTHGIKIV
jgi:GT2 family glycosyltransferase